MASLGRSANVAKIPAKRAESRLSGKTVPAATRAAQSVCVCIARPPRGLTACCPLLLSYYPLLVLGPLPQRMEVVGNGQRVGRQPRGRWRRPAPRSRQGG